MQMMAKDEQLPLTNCSTDNNNSTLSMEFILHIHEGAENSMLVPMPL